MRRNHQDDTNGKFPCASGPGGPHHRQALRFTSTARAHANRGFVGPVLIVFAALWFLLNGANIL